MAPRIDPDQTLTPVRIPARIFNEICQHARDAFPEECCGVITGDGSVRFRQVYRCTNLMSGLHERDPQTFPRDGREAFYMVDYIEAQEEAEARGEWVTAVYHSHVAHGAYFSELDQDEACDARFPFPQAAHLVVALIGREICQIGLFQRQGEVFQGRLVDVELA